MSEHDDKIAHLTAVAEMLGISVSAVGKHLAKGIAQLAILRKQQDRL